MTSSNTPRETAARLPAAAQRALQYYVYLYVDPRDDEIFYVGKGKGNRALAHLSDTTESEKRRRIEDIQRAGLAPRIEVLIHGLESEERAYRIEAAVIDAIGSDRLSNQVRGWRSRQYGRMEIRALAAMYAGEPADIVDDVLLIRINRSFRFGMTPTELYDATRGVWRLGPNREEMQYALAVFDGVVQEVYAIAGWYPAGSTLSTRGDLSDKARRWEFVGRVAADDVRRRYLHKRVDAHFPKGSQTPVRYVRGR